MSMRILKIHAVQCCSDEELSKTEDLEVKGIYSVEVDDSLDDAQAASAALDGFHSSIAVGMLEDFEFRVMDGDRELDEDPDHEGYSSEDYGDVWKDEDTPLYDAYTAPSL